MEQNPDQDERDKDEDEFESEGEEELDFKKKPSQASDEEDEVDWDEDDFDGEQVSESSDSGSDIEGVLEGKMMSRDFWKKKDEGPSKKVKDKEKPRAAPKQIKIREEEKVLSLAEQAAQAKDLVYTPQLVWVKLQETLALRAKKGVNRSTVVEDLQFLLSKSTASALSLKISCILISTLLDFNVSKAGYVPLNMWIKYLFLVSRLDSF